MRWIAGAAWVATLVGFPSGGLAADSSVYRDPETGFTFSQYNAAWSIGQTVAFRIAVPSSVPANTPFDAVLQVVAPKALTGWTGLCWGGSMLSNPLTLTWVNGNTPIVSSRYTTSRSMPTAYGGATYQIFKTGTKVNSTHWQFTAKCSGCTSFLGASNRNTVLNPTGTNHLAFAYGPDKPSNPSSNTSTFSPHEAYTYWYHDFAAAANPTFTDLVAKNL